MFSRIRAWHTVALSVALGALACSAGGTYGEDKGRGAQSGILSCEDPQPVLGIDGRETGFVSCDAGFLHRPERRDCASALPRPKLVVPPAGVGEPCRDEECTERPHGYCRVSYSGTSTYCDYGCVRDEDCGPDQVCVCGDPVGECVHATCSTDADCGFDSLCTAIPYKGACGEPLVDVLACREATDACHSATDCDDPREACQWRPEVGRGCVALGPCY